MPISKNHVQFIAEVSSNHHQDLARCLQFIDVAADIGCDAVKFQLFRIDQMFAPEILVTSAMHRARKTWELPVAFLPAIAERCQARGLLFACTPFHLETVVELLPYVDIFKIASYELLWDALLVACAQTGKPVILSTGMATLPEVQHAVTTLLMAGCARLTVLHCSSAYPTPVDEANLAALATLGMMAIPASWRYRREWDVGWSDHTVSPAVILRAVLRWHANVVEFHLDLDGSGDEFRTGHCWLPEQIIPVIQLIRDGERADGDGIKQPAPSERADIAWRRDPSDGLRPLRETRMGWVGDGKVSRSNTEE